MTCYAPTSHKPFLFACSRSNSTLLRMLHACVYTMPAGMPAGAHHTSCLRVQCRDRSRKKMRGFGTVQMMTGECMVRRSTWGLAAGRRAGRPGPAVRPGRIAARMPQRMRCDATRPKRYAELSRQRARERWPRWAAWASERDRRAAGPASFGCLVGARAPRGPGPGARNGTGSSGISICKCEPCRPSPATFRGAGLPDYSPYPVEAL